MKYIGALVLVVCGAWIADAQARERNAPRRNIISKSMQKEPREPREPRRKEAMHPRQVRPQAEVQIEPVSTVQPQKPSSVVSVPEHKKIIEPVVTVDKNFGTHVVAPERAAATKQEFSSAAQVVLPQDSSHSAVLPQKAADTFNKVFFNFENVDLQNVADFVEKTHKVKFITSDVVSGQAVAGAQPQAAVTFAGHKVSYRSHVALSKKESWDLFLTFLHMAGFALVPMALPDYYQVVPLLASATEVIPTFIGLHPDALPDNDMVIRYIYFMENLDPLVIKPLITKLQGNKNSIETYTDLRALLFSDKSRNIKALMKIVKELDKSTLPQAMSVLKLQRANAEDVKKMYNSLRTQSSDPNQRAWLPQYKESSLQYFPKEAIISSEPRTNSLIILGPKDAVKRIEDFILKYIDVELDAKSMPIYNYQLQYTKATDVKASLDGVLAYSASSSATAAQFGGVRDGYKYLQAVNIVADPYSNSLIINAHPDDYEIVVDLIKTLDRPQKQVAIELLIINVSHVKNKALGAQISNPNANSSTMGGLSFQTSGLGGSNIVTSAANGLRSGLNALLGNAAVNEAGSVLVTFGEPIWAIFKAIKNMSSTKIVTSQFMLTSNNYPAKFITGQSRQVKTSAVVNSSGNGDVKGYETVSANLSVSITPQINHHNMINLTIDIVDKDFLDHSVNSTQGDSVGKEIKTVACVANGEVLALGGMLNETNEGSQNGVPFLEKIPVLGWFFKSKTRSKNKSSYLVFVSAKVLDENAQHQDVAQFTKNKVDDAQHYIELVGHFESGDLSKDPINKAMFGEKHTTDLSTKTLVEDGELITPSVRFKQEKEAKSHVVLRKDKPTARERRAAKKALKKQKKLEKEQSVAVQSMTFDATKQPVHEQQSTTSHVAHEVLTQQESGELYYD